MGFQSSKILSYFSSLNNFLFFNSLGFESHSILCIVMAKEEPSVEKLKSFPGLENLTDEKAQEILFALQALSALLYEYDRQCNIAKKS